ncbi:MAG: dihydroorotate dehydrogenase electron transfer subunit [Clostridia bacterium]
MRDIVGKVVCNEKIARDIYKIIFQCDNVDDIVGGQFVNVQLPSKEKLLRRPFCICDCDKKNNTITICYAIVGQGTQDLSAVECGQQLKLLLPLGNGFVPQKGARIMLVGGGMGCAVLPAVARLNPTCKFDTYLGFANKDKVILDKEMATLSEKTVICTDDGSCGQKGFVTTCARQNVEIDKPDAIFCCGPEVMYKALAKAFADVDIPIFVSLERRMGCGIGACLVCNCLVKRNGKEGYLRACKDGPVFLLSEVIL